MLRIRSALFAFAFAALALIASAASAAPAPFCASTDPLARILATSSSGGTDAHPACGGYCDLTEGGTTPQGGAAGSTCAIAQANLTVLLRSYANTLCGGPPCDLDVSSVCQLQPGGLSYLAIGTATYGCHETTC